jgi:hypothetical protein
MARKAAGSDIAHAPPHVREIWHYLIREANHSGKRKHGERLERGQVLTTYEEIIEGLHWMVGWRKERYTKHQCEIAMKFLRKPRRNGSMITTRKTTRGLIITVCNYDYYQNPKNYESHMETDNENHNETGNSPQTTDTIDNELNELKNGNNVKVPPLPPKGGIPNCPSKAIIEKYHEILPELPRIVEPEPIKKTLKVRWGEKKERQNVEWWVSLFYTIGDSDFLMGRSDNWQCPGLGWIIGPKNLPKILNGNYRNRSKNGLSATSQHNLTIFQELAEEADGLGNRS